MSQKSVQSKKQTMKKNPKVTVKSLQMTKSQIETQKVFSEPRPSTSGTSKGGKPIVLSQSSEDSEYESDIAEEEKCCVCHTYEAGYLKAMCICFLCQ